jgi:small subunit ribosomal protein S18
MAYDKKKSRFKKRVCRFCGNREINIDYKNIDLLRNYVSETGKIEPRRITGTCAKHQRLVSNEIKKARQMALIAYVVE